MPRRIMEHEERRNRLQLMLTDDEMALLRRTAEKQGVAPGVYGRFLMLTALRDRAKGPGYLAGDTAPAAEPGYL